MKKPLGHSFRAGDTAVVGVVVGARVAAAEVGAIGLAGSGMAGAGATTVVVEAGGGDSFDLVAFVVHTGSAGSGRDDEDGQTGHSPRCTPHLDGPATRAEYHAPSPAGQPPDRQSGTADRC